jgi:hypothetical protein
VRGHRGEPGLQLKEKKVPTLSRYRPISSCPLSHFGIVTVSLQVTASLIIGSSLLNSNPDAVDHDRHNNKTFNSKTFDSKTFNNI